MTPWAPLYCAIPTPSTISAQYTHCALGRPRRPKSQPMGVQSETGEEVWEEAWLGDRLHARLYAITVLTRTNEGLKPQCNRTNQRPANQDWLVSSQQEALLGRASGVAISGVAHVSRVGKDRSACLLPYLARIQFSCHCAPKLSLRRCG